MCVKWIDKHRDQATINNEHDVPEVAMYYLIPIMTQKFKVMVALYARPNIYMLIFSSNYCSGSKERINQ